MIYGKFHVLHKTDLVRGIKNFMAKQSSSVMMVPEKWKTKPLNIICLDLERERAKDHRGVKFKRVCTNKLPNQILRFYQFRDKVSRRKPRLTVFPCRGYLGNWEDGFRSLPTGQGRANSPVRLRRSKVGSCSSILRVLLMNRCTSWKSYRPGCRILGRWGPKRS